MRVYEYVAVKRKSLLFCSALCAVCFTMLLFMQQNFIYLNSRSVDKVLNELKSNYLDYRKGIRKMLQCGEDIIRIAISPLMPHMLRVLIVMEPTVWRWLRTTDSGGTFILQQQRICFFSDLRLKQSSELAVTKRCKTGKIVKYSLVRITTSLLISHTLYGLIVVAPTG